MHKVYINDKPILFLQVYDTNEVPSLPGFQVISESNVSIEKIMADLDSHKDWAGVVYLCESPGVAWNYFASLFKLVPAAGGLVMNKKNEYLLIFRRGKWDLPKGKIDYDESPEQAALREVEEECGIKDLEIGEELLCTFHTYPQKGKMILKKTHWFRMQSEGKSVLVPQADEDIERAVWMTADEIREKVFVNTYASIMDLLVDNIK